MSDSIETKGKTVDEAVREALLQLGLRRDEVEIKVLEEPRAGLMGFIGSRQAKVLVSKRRARDRRGGGRERRGDEDHRAHDLTAEGSSGRGRGGRGRGGRDGDRDASRGGERDGGRGGRGGSDGREGRDEGRAGRGRGGRDGDRDASRGGERGGRGRGGRDRDGARDGARDEMRVERNDRDEAAPRARAAEGDGAREERSDGQRSRRRRGGRGRGGRGRSGQGAPREEQQGIDTTAIELQTDDSFDTVEVRRDEPRGGRGGRGRGGRGGRDRGDRPARDRDRDERPARDRDEIRFDQPEDTVAADLAVHEEIVPRERAREERSRRELRAPAPTPVAAAAPRVDEDGESVLPAVAPAAPAAPAGEVIDSAVVANVAPRAKPRAWGGLGSRRERAAAGPSLPRVEEPSPATAGAVIKPSRRAAARAAERAERAAPTPPQIGEIESPYAGPAGTVGYGASTGGGYGRGGADEVIASGIAATDYAKPLAPVGEAGQPALLTELAAGMLARAGFPCQVDTVPGEYHGVKVTADEDDAGMLIGRAGSTAEAVEHLVERMASNAAGDRVRMNLDINEYRVRREESIREHTNEAVAEVRQSGEPYHMEPMDARERRIVHMATADLPDITTYTVIGAGGKHVVIMLDDGSQPEDDGADGGDQ